MMLVIVIMVMVNDDAGDIDSDDGSSGCSES